MTTAERAGKVGHVRWEVEKLIEAFDRYRESFDSNHDNGDALLLEAFLLHARNLIDFFQQGRSTTEMRCRDFRFVRNSTEHIMSRRNIGDINNSLSHLAWARKDETINWLRPRLWHPLFNACADFARHVTAKDSEFSAYEKGKWDRLDRRIEESAEAIS